MTEIAPVEVTTAPFPGIGKPVLHHDRGWLPYTPDEIAVPLISAALRLIGAPANDVIALQTLAQRRAAMFRPRKSVCPCPRPQD